MALIATLGQNITKARTDDARLRAVNNFLAIYLQNLDNSSIEQPIPYCKDQNEANNLVRERMIPANSLFINVANGSLLGVARLINQGKKQGELIAKVK
jgi:hypothetical protein